MPKTRKDPASREVKYRDRTSQSEAARAIGISQQYISRLVQRGDVGTDADGRVSIQEIVRYRQENSILSRGNGQREPSQYLHQGFALEAARSVVDQAKENLEELVASCAAAPPGESEEARRARVREALLEWLDELHGDLAYTLVPDE